MVIFDLYVPPKIILIWQGEAISFNLRTMFALNISINKDVTCEGGSGNALAIGCVSKLFILENVALYATR